MISCPTKTYILGIWRTLFWTWLIQFLVYYELSSTYFFWLLIIPKWLMSDGSWFVTYLSSFHTELMTSQKLQDLLYMVLVAGNFLNSVSDKIRLRSSQYFRRKYQILFLTATTMHSRLMKLWMSELYHVKKLWLKLNILNKNKFLKNLHFYSNNQGWN
jgi:hypothetical protein